MSKEDKELLEALELSKKETQMSNDDMMQEIMERS